MNGENWIEFTIPDLVTKEGVFSDGDWVESKDQDPNGDVRLIQLADIGDGVFLNKSNRYLTSEKADELKCTFLENGDILVARMPAPLGRATIFPLKEKKRYVTVVDVAIIRFGHDFIDREFFLHSINSPYSRRKIESLQSGTTRKRISRKNLAKIDFLLAPLPEQRAIVAKIEQLFSELDNGIANLEAAKEKLEIYRQAVLKKAFEGELTKEWRRGNSIDRGQWSRKELRDVVSTIDGDRGKNYPKKHEFLSHGYCLFLSTKNVRQGTFVFEDNIFISKEKDEQLRGGKLERHDVVVTTRGTLGNVALYDEKVTYDNIRINSGMLILRVMDSSDLNPTFLMKFVTSPLFFQQLRSKQSGTAQPQIPAGVLKEIEIDLPHTIAEQNKIVEEIETRLSVCDYALYNIDEGLHKAEVLRQSILKKAFEGKLLSEEELEACRKEVDWEPADKLLERIKKQRNETV